MTEPATAAWKCPRCGITYKGGSECPKCLIPKPATAATEGAPMEDFAAKHPHGSLVEQVHRVITTDQGVDPWVIAEEAVAFILDTTGKEDRIFCPDCARAIFYQRLHVSTHETECPATVPA